MQNNMWNRSNLQFQKHDTNEQVYIDPKRFIIWQVDGCDFKHICQTQTHKYYLIFS